MTYRSRRDDLQALGLVDWMFRPDGPLHDSSTRLTAAGPPVDRTPPIAAQATQQETGQSTQPAADRAAVDPATGQADQAAVQSAPAIEPAMSGVPVDGLVDHGLASMDWADLEAYLAACDHRGAMRPVFGVGARDADVLVVGEAPGAHEDAQGIPFVGRAGKLLDRMLFAIGCSRERNVYITNICKFRPPDNRDPTAEEVAADWPILERQIDLMAPKLVVAVGRIAAQTLLASKEPLGQMRGHMHRYPQRELDVLVTYHPAYLLRSPQQKAKAWEDLQAIARHIGSLAP